MKAKREEVTTLTRIVQEAVCPHIIDDMSRRERHSRRDQYGAAPDVMCLADNPV
jgi:hypothetical protein